MRRYFNTEGQCEPDEHYMVRLDERLREMRQRYVDRGKYFVINRGRQYGKTTTLLALAEYLKKDYFVLFMDFQKMSTSVFENEHKFAVSFTNYFVRELRESYGKTEAIPLQDLMRCVENEKFDLNEMFVLFCKLCGECLRQGRPLVLMIDEVDSASNYQVFVDFLALLRGYYLERKNKPTFWSVILAGVYDIKNLKLKLRPNEERKYNSPWNIAAKFSLEMSFSADQIAGMLSEYEEDHHTGMDIYIVSKCIYEYTCGYPYLVSAICKLLDEEIAVWSSEGIAEAVKYILKENTSLRSEEHTS